LKRYQVTALGLDEIMRYGLANANTPEPLYILTVQNAGEAPDTAARIVAKLKEDGASDEVFALTSGNVIGIGTSNPDPIAAWKDVGIISAVFFQLPGAERQEAVLAKHSEANRKALLLRHGLAAAAGIAMLGLGVWFWRRK